MQEIQTETQNELTLELKVTDLNTVKYLKSFEQSLSSEKALEALRIGVIAIQSASPTLDTKIVDEKFQVISSLIDEVFGERNGKLPKLFKDYFGNDESKLAQIFKDYLEQDKGKMPKIFQQYFGDDKNTNGKLSQIIQKQVGPESEFAKSIDPTNTNSIIYRFKNEVQENIKDLFVDLKEELGLQAGKEIGKKEEAEKGTEKGREFETVLYLRIAELGRQIGDLTESVGNTPGVVPRSKTGDYLITLGDTSAAPGTKIVIEAKSAKAYKLRDAIEELDEAKKNREAFAGIFVFSKGYEPPEVGDFHQVGNDFFITVDNEVLEDNQRLLFLEAAYKIIRALTIAESSKESVKEADFTQVKRKLDVLISLVGNLSKLSTSSKTIVFESKKIDAGITELAEQMDQQISEINAMLNHKT